MHGEERMSNTQQSRCRDSTDADTESTCKHHASHIQTSDRHLVEIQSLGNARQGWPTEWRTSPGWQLLPYVAVYYQHTHTMPYLHFVAGTIAWTLETCSPHCQQRHITRRSLMCASRKHIAGYAAATSEVEGRLVEAVWFGYDGLPPGASRG
jgi:hypothetical protein